MVHDDEGGGGDPEPATALFASDQVPLSGDSEPVWVQVPETAPDELMVPVYVLVP